MKVEIVEDAASMAARAADIICETARRKPDCVLGLPTGATPIGAYAELSRRAEAGACDLSGCIAFAVDEFAGAARGAPGTNGNFFERHLRVSLKALHVPDSAATDPDTEIRGFATAIDAAGGMDLCLLGIGTNGHVAFNEPGSGRDTRARAIDLAAETREAHAAAFGGLERVTARGMTLGIAEIMAARAIVVAASGAHKAAIVGRAIEGPQTAAVPASWLRDHGAVTWLLDRAAAADLKRRT